MACRSWSALSFVTVQRQIGAFFVSSKLTRLLAAAAAGSSGRGYLGPACLGRQELNLATNFFAFAADGASGRWQALTRG